jgi:hypothetical protein
VDTDFSRPVIQGNLWSSPMWRKEIRLFTFLYGVIYIFAEMGKNNILFMCTWIKVLEMLFFQSVAVLPVLEAVVSM